MYKSKIYYYFSLKTKTSYNFLRLLHFQSFRFKKELFQATQWQLIQNASVSIYYCSSKLVSMAWLFYFSNKCWRRTNRPQSRQIRKIPTAHSLTLVFTPHLTQARRFFFHLVIFHRNRIPIKLSRWNITFHIAFAFENHEVEFSAKCAQQTLSISYDFCALTFVSN